MSKLILTVALGLKCKCTAKVILAHSIFWGEGERGGGGKGAEECTQNDSQNLKKEGKLQYES